MPPAPDAPDAPPAAPAPADALAAEAVDLGETTSLDVLAARVPLAGRLVLDVGCGDMTVARQLVGAGARVLALDPDPAQAAANRAAEPLEGLEFREAGAETLPVAAGSADGVVFSFSLHHVPVELHARALAEARRVLRPDGFLCVIEPTGGPLNEVMRHFHDEEIERAAARRSVIEHALPAFERAEVLAYHSPVVWPSFDDFADHALSRTFNDGYGEKDVRNDVVRRAFEAAAAPEADGSRRFASGKLMVLLQGPRPVG